MTAMVAGDTHFTAISTLLSLPQIQAGALRAIATGSLTREAHRPPHDARIPGVIAAGNVGRRDAAHDVGIGADTIRAERLADVAVEVERHSP